MTTFDDRQRQEEAKYKHDQEFLFKVRNRRNKLFGMWIAGQLGLSGEEAVAYAKEVIIADFEKPGDEDVYEKVKADLEGKGLPVDDEGLRRKMTALEAEATAQIKAE